MRPCVRTGSWRRSAWLGRPERDGSPRVPGQAAAGRGRRAGRRAAPWPRTVERGGGRGRRPRLPGGGEGPGPHRGTGQGGRDQGGGRRRPRPPPPGGPSWAWTSRATPSTCVLVEPACDIAAEYYASFTFDRAARLHLGLLSAQGGVDIEQVAARDPDAVARVHVDPIDGLSRRRRPRPGRPGRPRRRGGARAWPPCSPGCTTPTSAPTPTWWRSTPWWSPARARWWPSTPR